ncbi:hypothetical protein Tco_0950600, partial [Tanacetum coccineum]
VSNAIKARRSQPKSTITHDKTLPANTVPEMKVEDHHRKNKSKLSKKNSVDSSTNVRSTVFNMNSNSVCNTCRTDLPLVSDSGCSKHMTGDQLRLRNFVKKFIGTLTSKTAPVHSSPGPAPNLLTPGPISSGLVPNPPPAAPYVPPTNKELEILF